MPAKWSKKKWSPPQGPAAVVETAPTPAPAPVVAAEPEMKWKAEYNDGKVFFFRSSFNDSIPRAQAYARAHGGILLCVGQPSCVARP